MNVRIFWVRAMKCMHAQTRPRFILSSEGVLGGMEFEPMLTPREKSRLPKMSPEEDRTRDAVDSEPKHYQLSYSGPCHVVWRDNSAVICNSINFDRISNQIYFSFILWTDTINWWRRGVLSLFAKLHRFVLLWVWCCCFANVVCSSVLFHFPYVFL